MILTVRYVLIPVFCSLTGYSDKAVRRKIEEGIWVEGVHYRKAPDGHINMDLEAYPKWVEGTLIPASKPGKHQSG